MKKIFLALFSFAILAGCTNDGMRYKNPNLPNYSFSINIDSNLPSYVGLKSPINPIYIVQDNVGVSGIIVMKVTDTDFRAWEANCPNHPPSGCSRMSIKGIYAKCNCDDMQYSLFDGTGKGQYSMKPYAVEVFGNGVIRVYN
jgi:hypothetical protein